MRKAIWLAGLASLAAAGPASAQEGQTEAGSWTVTAQGGPLFFAEASALQRGTGVGLAATYYVTPRIGIGPAADFVYTTSDGRYFIGVLDFGPDSTRIYEVGQQLSILHYGAQVVLDLMPGGRMAPYLAGGAGGHAIYLDGNANDRARRVTGLHFQAGAGLRFAVGEATGIHVDIRDIIYTGFDREELNPVRVEHRNRRPDGTVRFPGAEHDLPDPTETVHNIRVSVGFRYVPGNR